MSDVPVRASVEHLPPTRRIGKSHTNGVFYECRNISRLSGRHKGADFVDLLVLKRDGDLGGRHTEYHSMAMPAPGARNPEIIAGVWDILMLSSNPMRFGRSSMTLFRTW
jgi:hypothetical protein